MRPAARAGMGEGDRGGAGQPAARLGPGSRRRAGRRLGRNGRFYRDGAEYLGHLRRLGRTDYAFEDEMYYTMPAVSSPSGG